MLEKLTIKNIALIDNAEIEFTNGLNVLSGETGSGKSVILESLNFVLGAKADKSLIRSGQTECFVCAEFFIGQNESFNNLFEQLDFDIEDKIIIARKFTIDGKNSIKLNGNSVTATMLKKFSSRLVDVHGQSEHYQLLSSSNQLKLLDNLGGETLSYKKEVLRKKHDYYKEILDNITLLGGNESQREIRLDVLNFQINEIEKACVKEGEEEKLLEIRSQIHNQEKILSALNCVKSAINDEGGCSDILYNCQKMLAGLENISDKYNEIYSVVSNINDLLGELNNNTSNLIDEIDSTDYDVDTIEERLDTIKTIKKKYGNTYQDIMNFYNNALLERENLENFDKKYSDLLNQKVLCEKELYNLYSDLSVLRRNIAKEFSNNVLCELRQLAMENASFSIAFNQPPEFEQCSFNSANGFDTIEFMFSANKGEPLKELSNIISGGEMSRFMLAIKVLASKNNDVNTFIFDEIDAGISGNTAKVVAQKFAILSKSVQIIAITHLPQISAMADTNLLIKKQTIDDSTKTIVESLDYNSKIKEVSRLAGGGESENSILLAKELVQLATQYKESL